MQYVKSSLQSPQLQSGSSQSSPSQDSPKGAEARSPLLSKPRIQELVREVDPTVQIDENFEDMLLQLADDFLETALNASCSLAKHRYSDNVELKDVQLHLERQWNMNIPGFGSDKAEPYRQTPVSEVHKKRMKLISKIRPF